MIECDNLSRWLMCVCVSRRGNGCNGLHCLGIAVYDLCPDVRRCQMCAYHVGKVLMRDVLRLLLSAGVGVLIECPGKICHVFDAWGMVCPIALQRYAISQHRATFEVLFCNIGATFGSMLAG